MREASKQEVQDAYTGWDPLVMQLIDVRLIPLKTHGFRLTMDMRPSGSVSPSTKRLCGRSIPFRPCLPTLESE